MPKVTIDVEARFIDHVTDGASKAVSALQKLEQISKKLNTSGSIRGLGSASFLRNADQAAGVLKKLQLYGDTDKAVSYADRGNISSEVTVTAKPKLDFSGYDIASILGRYKFGSMDLEPSVNVRPKIEQPDIFGELERNIKTDKSFEVGASVKANFECEGEFDESELEPEGGYLFTTDAKVDADYTTSGVFDESELEPEGGYSFTTDAQVGADYTATGAFDESAIAPEGGYSFTTDAQVGADYTAAGAFDESAIAPEGGYSFTTDAQVDANYTATGAFDESAIAPESRYSFTTDAQVDANYTASGTFDPSQFAPEGGYSFSTDAQVDANYTTSGAFDSSQLKPEGVYSFTTDVQIDANYITSGEFDPSELEPEGAYSFTTDVQIDANYITSGEFDPSGLEPKGVYSFTTDVQIDANYTTSGTFDASQLAPEGVYSFTTDAQVIANYTTSGTFDSSTLAPLPNYSFHTSVSINPSFSVTSRFNASAESFGVPSSVTRTVTVYVNSNIVSSGGGYRRARGGIIGKNGPIGFAGGGLVKGGPQLVTVAEEGTPEMIIPLGLQRRKRGMDLWRKAGHLLGVEGFADGGIVGNKGRMPERFPESITPDARRSAEPVGFPEQSEPVRERGSTNTSVSVDVGGVTLQIDVKGETDDIVAGIERNKDRIADMIAGVMRGAVEETFANTPLLGGETA